MNCLTAFIDSALVISSSTDTLQRDRQTGRGGGGGELEKREGRGVGRRTERQTEPNETQCRC